MKKKSIWIVGIIAVVVIAACYALRTKHIEEYMPTEFLFADNGCLKKDMMAGYADDMKCLDANKDGCVTRAEWDAVMDYWTTRTPEPGQSLCDRK
ncbi:hypothetical protein FACS18945_2250 [Bacteroidia bacterium]|nr:hypothetical protein FACS18945_2250 [Bacteroidia bacterium]